jgi:hypothetical protein
MSALKRVLGSFDDPSIEVKPQDHEIHVHEDDASTR